MRVDRFLLAGLFGLLLAAGIASGAAVNYSTLRAGLQGLDVTVRESNESQARFELNALGVTPPASGLSDEQALPMSGGMLWACPASTRDVQLVVQNEQWRAAASGEFSDSIVQVIRELPRPLATASNILSVRGIKLVSIAVQALRYSEENQFLQVCERADIALQYVRDNGLDTAERLYSQTFHDVLDGVVANLDDVAPVSRRLPEPYLIVTPDGYAGSALNTLIQWKRQKGHTVTVATTTQTGSQNSAIRDYIREAYNTWDEPPVFVLLVGDVDGTNPLPGWVMDGFYTATIISDHPYSLLDEGDDWLPDVFVGRLSVDSPTDLQTVVNKIVNYERTPFEPNGEWRNQMLIAGVRSTPGFFSTYNTAWPTLRWIGREFMQSGYSAVDSVPYPNGNAQQINANINSGVSFVAYRGFGSPHDWAFPPYDNSNVNQLANGQRLPFVTSIVCGGGAFDSDVDPCFGELWLRAGTPTTPKGAIAFIGPSELDTKTRWNNTNIAAIYQGILHENVNCASAAMLRGKMELLRQFPAYVDNLTSDSDRSPWFYFHCYNLLGDPGLNFFVGTARDLSAEIPDNIPLGAPSLDVSVESNGESLADVWATLKRDTVIVSRAIGTANGHVVLAIPQDAAGTYDLTLTKPRHMPQIVTVNVGQQQSYVAASVTQIVDDGSNGSSGNGNGLVDAGETIALRVRVRNFGTQTFNGGTLAMTSADGSMSIVNGQATLPTLAAGAESGFLYLTAYVYADGHDGSTGRLDWSVNGGTYAWTTAHEISSGHAQVVDIRTNGETRNPNPGENAELNFVLTNNGHAPISAFDAFLSCYDPRFVVTDSVGFYGGIAIGASAAALNGFHAQCGDFYSGDWVVCYLRIVGDNYNTVLTFRVHIGTLVDTDPTQPDEYGYRAFQDTDVGYDEVPAYAWFEIDPTRGGPGTVFNLPDTGEGRDTTRATTLPFSFRFYGTLYDQVSICSNGFISFGSTRESYLRNYSLPAIASPDNMIAAFWDDLSMGDEGRVCTYHDQQGGRFIIEWSHLQNEYSSHPEETFQIALYDTTCWPTRTGDGDILVQWQQFNNIDSWDNYATIGLQDMQSANHLLITYANELQPGVSTIRSGQSMLFTTGRPSTGAYVSYAGSEIDDDNEGGSNGNDDGVAQNGETVQLSLRLRNTGEESSQAFSATLTSPDARIVVLDANVSFPQIPPGEEANSAPVRIQIATTAPNGLIATLLLSLGNDAAPCVVVATLAVAGPVLSGLPPVMNDDSSPPSIGNGNGEANPRETLELFPHLSNTGGNGASGVTAVLRSITNDVTILDSTVAIGNVPVNQELTAAESFVFRLNNGVGNGQTVPLRLVFRDQYGTVWNQSTSLLVVEPFLAVGSARISDPAPGGNADGYLVGGETAELFPSIRNDGLGAATNVMMTVACVDTSVTLANTQQLVGTVSGGSSREPALPVLIQAHDGNPEPRNIQITVTATGDGGLHVSKTVSVLIGIARFYTDFEVDANLWSHFGRHNSWHTQTREFASPNLAYYCGNENRHEYEGASDEYLRSPEFTFAGHGTLIYQTRYETASAADLCKVQLQIGSSTYFLLETYSGGTGEWEERRVSLANYPAANDARIRFWFLSDITGAAEGWYVDNVLVVDEDLGIDDDHDLVLPDRLELEQNFPNPFNDETSILYRLPKRSDIKLTLFDVTGRQVATLVEGARDAGSHVVHWHPLSLGSGIFFVRLEAAGQSLTRKIVYLR